MRSLVFNPFSGASGDMILGCAIDLGLTKSGQRTDRSFHTSLLRY